ncbi:GNAT family N-acetyltransferase [Paenactinomyces guangxiensis]|uniref:N-acetyltransferase domain-containing protein n=1 Tax=Paenactinomyces guangxiensis TaxID=1490290 RepID=A0A7W1WTY1_9BACL|nr:hypothetical protein [Paenactinomyces guangxiensis]MBA4495943.1 hypothetical protein [Paenactinomyces guangxiensis]MBH8593070.1 hypothetical protein [Paenactinomyces guangxiensis]
MFVIRRAAKRDIFQVRKLLNEAGLNDRGVDKHLEHFFVVESPGENGSAARITGAVGMEVYRPCGLLRSFVLERASWNPKVGLQLIQILLAYAGHLQLSHVYLLAGASASFFEQIGFAEVPFADLPEDISGSEHLEHTGPNGTPMVYACFPSGQH